MPKLITVEPIAEAPIVAGLKIAELQLIQR
jgi:hypothetical protein